MRHTGRTGRTATTAVLLAVAVASVLVGFAATRVAVADPAHVGSTGASIAVGEELGHDAAHVAAVTAARVLPNLAAVPHARYLAALATMIVLSLLAASVAAMRSRREHHRPGLWRLVEFRVRRFRSPPLHRVV